MRARSKGGTGGGVSGFRLGSGSGSAVIGVLAGVGLGLVLHFGILGLRRVRPWNPMTNRACPSGRYVEPRRNGRGAGSSFGSMSGFGSVGVEVVHA